MSWNIDDRRQKRSTDREVALAFQLDHSRQQGGIEALVLADDDGLLVAASGDTAVCEELGAVAPLVGRSAMGMPMPPLLRGGDVAVRPLEVYGQNLFLASVGGGVARDALLKVSIHGVERILSSN